MNVKSCAQNNDNNIALFRRASAGAVADMIQSTIDQAAKEDMLS